MKRKTFKQQLKEEEKRVKNSLSIETVEKYNLGNNKSTVTNYSLEPTLKGEIELVKDSSKFEDDKKIKLLDIDDFLLSGRFNSVLGPDGIKYFKNEIKQIIDKVNKNDSETNLINLDKFFEILLRSGIYYEDKYVPSSMEYLGEDYGWLTAYRFIAKNFRDITYKEFRLIVKDIQKSDGNTIEFDEKDRGTSILKKIKESGLFTSEVSVESYLSRVGMAELRSICKELNISSKRSKEETIEEITKGVDRNTLEIKFKLEESDLMYSIRDLDLVAGSDIVHLDKYLRDISRHIRNDLFEFVEEKQSYKLEGVA